MKPHLAKALKERDANFHFTMDQIPGHILVTDADNQCIWVNKKRLEFTGRSIQQEIGKGWLETIHPDDLDICLKIYSEHFEQRKPFTFEYRLRRSNGEFRWMLDAGQPRYDEHGNFMGYIYAALDISEQKTLLDALLHSEASVRTAIERSLHPIMLHAEDGRVIMLSQSWTDLSGYSIEDIPTTAAWVENAYGIPPEKVRELLLRPDPPWKTGRDGEFRIRTRSGQHRYWDIMNAPMPPLPDGRHAWLSMAIDITEKKQTEEQLHLAAKVFENSIEGIAITDAVGHILSVNNAFSEMTGFTAEEVTGVNAPEINFGMISPDINILIRQGIKQNGYWEGEVRSRRKSGEFFHEWLRITAIKNDQGKIINCLGIFSDISARKISEEKIHFLAYHDNLTSLPNRLLIRDRMEQARAYADREKHKLALLFLDLDNFKTINDSLGHKCGDALLILVAERLGECLRETDLISRQGGDEFLIVLSELKDSEVVTRICEKILARLLDPFFIEGNELTTSASIGVSMYPDDGVDFDTLLRQADTAMYRAKDGGRNTWRFFDEKMNQDAVEHLHIRNGLRRALENNEFVLHYQPQINLHSGKVVGAEALIRWKHPENGLIPPIRFIPIAEESGLIVPIGSWVIHEACRQAVRWQQDGLPPLVIAVNMSTVQFKRGEVEKTVVSALEESGLDPTLLELELTESILIRDTENVLATIRRLKLLGVKLSIDDFGTGYSSLSYLKRFAVDRLKIDQSFIRSMATSPEDTAIVRAIIHMAEGLNLKTIAEGVEDEALLEFLSDYRCDEVQGYFFAKPMPSDEFTRYVRNAIVERAQKAPPTWLRAQEEITRIVGGY
jgi:diguanylate cyclase (GGDEF)-like protein/PAS domain S-box-containing protein